jgi:hypothetical protein
MKSATIKRTSDWLWFTVPIGLLLLVSAGGGIFLGNLYRDSPSFAAQAVGQDYITFFVVLPIMIVSAILAGRGSPQAQIIWFGGLIYIIYTYVVAAFDVKFNPLFLVYVALLGCSIYALILGLLSVDLDRIKSYFTQKTPINVVSIYLIVLAVLFYFLWLSEIVPAIFAGKVPQSILDNGTPTNAVHVLDMAWILPAIIITAVSLRRKQAWGYTLAGALLSYMVLLILAILGMVMEMAREGVPIVIPQVVIFGSLLAISLGMCIWYLKGLEYPSL